MISGATDAPIVRFKDLCLDVNDLSRAAAFWAPALGLRGDGDALVGPTPHHRVWLNTVPEPHTVKNRVHWDVHTADVADLLARGASRLSEPGQFRWTVLADPEGNEFCAFERDRLPDSGYLLYELAVDCADPARQAEWWQAAWGGETGADEQEGFTWVSHVPGMPFEGVTFEPVPEPKTVKNRLHWDVTALRASAVAELVDRGAEVLREPDGEVRWTVMADPEGNEFCVFAAGG